MMGMQKYAENCSKDPKKYDFVVKALDEQLNDTFPQKLRMFREILNQPGAETKANYETVVRTVKFLEGRTNDFTHMRAAFSALEAKKKQSGL